MDILDISAKLREGRFEFSRHAFLRVVERDITEEEIRQTGSRAEIIEDYPHDKYSPSCLLLGITEAQRPLHLQVCYTDDDTLKIVTIYEPKAEHWVDFRRRRE